MRLQSFLAFAIWIVLLGLPASAQTPAPHPDVPLKKVGGVYDIGCHTPLDTDLDQVCWVRTDLSAGVIELGCLHGPSPDTTYRTDISVQQTPNENADVKCYVSDTEGLVSEYSDNSGLIDFTRPGRPRIVYVPEAARTWPQSRQRKGLLLEFDEPDEIVLWTPRERLPAQRKTLTLLIED